MKDHWVIWVEKCIWILARILVKWKIKQCLLVFWSLNQQGDCFSSMKVVRKLKQNQDCVKLVMECFAELCTAVKLYLWYMRIWCWVSEKVHSLVHMLPIIHYQSIPDISINTTNTFKTIELRHCHCLNCIPMAKSKFVLALMQKLPLSTIRMVFMQLSQTSDVRNYHTMSEIWPCLSLLGQTRQI